MSKNEDFASSLDDFFKRNLISEVIHVMKSGKEATVFLCRGCPGGKHRFLAGKVYRDLNHRGFMRDGAYQDGRVILESRLARAFSNKSAKGREVQYGVWIDAEWKTLKLLHAAGASVPVPVARGDKAILMEFVGETGGDGVPLRAPSLHDFRPTPEEAGDIWRQVSDEAALMLSCNRVHADLSPYNVLWHDGRAVVIDFPQAVDARNNSRSFEFLQRDLANIARYCEKFGHHADWFGAAAAMWEDYIMARL